MMALQTYPTKKFDTTYCSKSVASMWAQFMTSLMEEKRIRSKFSSEYSRGIKNSMTIHQCIKNTDPEVCNKYHKPAECYCFSPERGPHQRWSTWQDIELRSCITVRPTTLPNVYMNTSGSVSFKITQVILDQIFKQHSYNKANEMHNFPLYFG